MAIYALVVTADARFLPGVNAMLNAVRYYGMDDDGEIELHLLHNFPRGSEYIEQAGREFASFLHLVNITDFLIESGHWDHPIKHTKSSMKYGRWWYPAERLADYDAICVLDADRLIVNDLRPYMRMIARSGMIGLAKNDWSEAEWDTYDDKRAMSKNPPLYSNPYFITGKMAKEIFPLIPEYAENPNKYYPPYKGRGPTTGDMHPVNLTLIQTGNRDNLILLPATQWVFVEMNHVLLQERKVGGKKYIGIHGKGDLLYSIHRRYWAQRDCARLMNGHTQWTKLNAVNNVKLLWDFYRFFNEQLYLRIPWIWGEFPPIPEY